jgi:hypothetical protein
VTKAVRVGRGVAGIQVGSTWRVRGVGGDHPEAVVGELGDREVGLEGAALVEPLRVGDDARGAVDPVGRDPVEHLAGVAALTRNFDMKDMSITITPSRAARCSSAQ